jgi:hypothetical protein
VQYSAACTTNRLAAIATVIDAGSGNGVVTLLAGSTPLAAVTLAKPSATASGAVLNFNGLPIITTATGSGKVTSASVADSAGNIAFTTASVGIAGSSADVVISNGRNSLEIDTGQTVYLLGMQITSSN